MKALIFAAGLGERMRPLTDTTPKPLLQAGGKPLIAWHLEKLAALGVRDVVVNTSWLAAQFPQVLGDGARWGLRLHFSFEGDTPLETGGGMWNALPLLADTPNAPFIAVNGDVWTDYDFARLPDDPSGDAHLVMVNNPPQHPAGDFAFEPLPPAEAARVERAAARGFDEHAAARHEASEAASDLLRADGPHTLTFSGIGVYRPALFDHWRDIIGNAPGAADTPPRFKLAPLLRAAMADDRVTGDYHLGEWTDVGTPQRLAALDARLRSQ